MDFPGGIPQSDMNRNDDTIFHSRFSLAEQLFLRRLPEKKEEN
jgi:hypothetical protein